MMYLDLPSLEATPLSTDPFRHVVVPKFVRAQRLPEVIADFPDVPGPGSHPPSELKVRGAFKSVMDELLGDEFRNAVERKFDVDLSGKPTMYTVRGYTRQKDGGIHTDSKTKIVTVLLYLNEAWDPDGGRLRLLRNGMDLDDYAAEISPTEGNLLIFLRSDSSWHGHKPFQGRRRAIQLNWVTSQDVVDKEQARHRFSTRIKKLTSLIAGRSA
ncbi:2OG-Fe(II) oxygenase [Pseudaminobacter sp. 19-2017]|uniref:2OG-Fe(II) oxygenase n=1 Tax=Pseudaminobacter soli (ex Zhang et al. 2022) TaxID=2831468 RepID=A0A942DXY2_9HYPH|nr:2OG-Fe(II) oxygenase [Pseudaminobacter soli]MBS3647468.1 2OG-Fe(II) oxygenase [Pseudaminobacter soli]